ncbi:MAG: hypothetical protein AVDCRST_MAG27-4188, partial [uncultured Craurococcus sp.]
APRRRQRGGQPGHRHPWPPDGCGRGAAQPRDRQADRGRREIPGCRGHDGALLAHRPWRLLLLGAGPCRQGPLLRRLGGGGGSADRLQRRAGAGGEAAPPPEAGAARGQAGEPGQGGPDL